ncbi:hypothetical protein [Devosia sp.]|uniref:hypothetical protein n=1 Tax=Devosia sp. TaxID=1871048 RepID=UPI002FC9E97E
MNDPRVSAIICALVALWLGYTIFFSSESPSTFLAVLQWTFFVVALAGLGAAMARLMRGRQ